MALKASDLTLTTHRGWKDVCNVLWRYICTYKSTVTLTAASFAPNEAAYLLLAKVLFTNMHRMQQGYGSARECQFHWESPFYSSANLCYEVCGCHTPIHATPIHATPSRATPMHATPKQHPQILPITYRSSPPISALLLPAWGRGRGRNLFQSSRQL